MDENPYASPLADSSIVVPRPSSAESIREEFISHEASIKSIGLLYALGAVLMVFVGLIILGGTLFGSMRSGGAEAETIILVVAIFYLGLGLLQGAIAYGLRTLQTWARYVAVVFSALGLIAIPIGTIISGYFLYLLLSQKGTMVFSEEYKQIILETPHVKRKTSVVAMVLLALLIVVLFVGLAMVLGG